MCVFADLSGEDKMPGVEGVVVVGLGVVVARLGAALPGVLGSEAGDVEFQDHGVVDQAIDGGCSGHRVLEDPVPLAED